MSLYTISSLASLPTIKKPAGLRIEESTDVTLLATMGETTVEEVIKRLANNHSAFVTYFHDQPAAFGWMARSKANIGELNHELILPEGNRYLWNFRTLADFRGLGIYPALLQYIINYESKSANQFWIIHAPENKSSLSGIVKAGFVYAGKLYTDANGAATLESNTLAETYRDILESMDIQVSDETGASCWNCSSPYLKKRKPECCCSTAGSECNSNVMLSMVS